VAKLGIALCADQPSSPPHRAGLPATAALNHPIFSRSSTQSTPAPLKNAQDYPMEITANSVVSFHYKVVTSAGEAVDQSEKGEPLVYLHGHGNIVPGLEKQMIGKKTGDKFTANVAAKEAYGELDKELDLQVPLDVFPPNVRDQIQPGFRFRAEHPTLQGNEVTFTVVQVDDQHAYVSGNHPLAGKDLVFDIEIAEVRAASKEEVSHGHAHGPGGHHHH
jgi:FKBP-type peptidyl-prolyl cis-trans isomerase SlyD